jgi:polyisoprenoid-binding protein YceI
MSATTFVIDPSHSEALFTVRHLITKVRGRFRQFAGTIQFDEAAIDRSSVTFTIQASSIDTNEPNRDTHLRSADFFDVENTPTITFVSRAVLRTTDQAFTVTGTLTMHGISRR